MKKSEIHFHGGARSVTGANFLLRDASGGASLLIDCGLFQGEKIGEDVNRRDFPYDPASIDALFVTHGHIDHIGRIPKLVKEGFRGTIYSTPPTRDIAFHMLDDSRGVLEKEARAAGVPPLYEKKDVEAAMRLWKGIPYHTPVDAGAGYRASFFDAGHILGSAMVVFEREERRVAFTGDLGNSPAPLLKDTEDLPPVDYLVMESVYGDRNHEGKEKRREILEDIIEEAMARGGALLVPAFSLERTQVLLFEINFLAERGKIPSVPVFLDSPLAIALTGVYRKYESYFNKAANDIIKSGDDIFRFPRLRFTKETRESKAIANVPNPKVIIAGSGMSNGGRIVHHLKRHLPDPKNTVLLVGYQAAGTRGRLLSEGVKSVDIDGEEIPVRARIRTLHGYSAHKEMDDLVDFADRAAKRLKHAFLCMGEPHASLFLAQRLRDYLGIHASVPAEGEKAEIDV